MYVYVVNIRVHTFMTPLKGGEVKTYCYETTHLFRGGGSKNWPFWVDVINVWALI